MGHSIYSFSLTVVVSLSSFSVHTKIGNFIVIIIIIIIAFTNLSRGIAGSKIRGRGKHVKIVNPPRKSFYAYAPDK